LGVFLLELFFLIGAIRNGGLERVNSVVIDTDASPIIVRIHAASERGA
jgi:hypothetical protein